MKISDKNSANIQILYTLQSYWSFLSIVKLRDNTRYIMFVTAWFDEKVQIEINAKYRTNSVEWLFIFLAPEWSQLANTKRRLIQVTLRFKITAFRQNISYIK